jgi:hypothetical protein
MDKNVEAIDEHKTMRTFTNPSRRIRPQETIETGRKKSEDFPVGILLPGSIDFRCFPAATGPYFLTWETKK